MAEQSAPGAPCNAGATCGVTSGADGLSSRRTAWILGAILIASLALRVTVAASLDIFQDEAMYWWQSHEDVTFCPHPPVTPLSLKAGYLLFGQGVFAIRVISLLAMTGAIAVAYLIARDLSGRRAGLWAAALVAACPFLMVVGSVATPDCLLVFVWLLLLWTTCRAVATGRLAWWVATGVVFAAGLFTKYMMVFAAPCIAAGLLVPRSTRPLLRRPGPWLAMLIGAAVFVPVFVAWNATHEWAAVQYHLSSRHQWTLAGSANAREYLLRHGGAYSPVLWVVALVALGYGAYRACRGEARLACPVAFGVLPIALFLIPNLFTVRQLERLQWDEFGYAAALVAAGALVGVVRRVRVWRAVLIAALGVAIIVDAVLLIAGCVPGLPDVTGIRATLGRLQGWSGLAAKVRQLEAAGSGRRPILVAESFITAVSLGFRLGRTDDIYALDTPRNERYGFVEELNRWGIDEQHLGSEAGGREAILVGQQCRGQTAAARPPSARIYRFFKSVQFAGSSDVPDNPNRVFPLYRCTGPPQHRN